MNLSSDEVERYRRHIALDEVGSSGQLALKAARVLVVGAGGLGAPVSLYLAAAGVGTIGIVDSDTVETSNLQRQILFAKNDVGRSKITAAAERLNAANEHIDVAIHDAMIDDGNAESLIDSYDIVVDCTDNFAARYAINDACLAQNKPFVYGSIYRFEGQVSVFCADGPCYRCLYPLSVGEDLIPNCAEAGVFGALAGVVGSLQAAEVIKLILGAGQCLIGRLLLYDALAVDFSVLTLNRNENCVCHNARDAGDVFDAPDTRDVPDTLDAPNTREAHTGCNTSEVKDAERLAGQNVVANIDSETVQSFELSPDALRSIVNIVDSASSADAADKSIVLLDVRTLQEHRAMRLRNDQHIPLDELNARINEIAKGQKIVVYCRSGVRSRKAARMLREAGHNNVYNLTGGIMAWWRSFQDEHIVSDVPI